MSVQAAWLRRSRSPHAQHVASEACPVHPPRSGSLLGGWFIASQTFCDDFWNKANRILQLLLTHVNKSVCAEQKSYHPDGKVLGLS